MGRAASKVSYKDSLEDIRTVILENQQACSGAMNVLEDSDVNEVIRTLQLVNKRVEKMLKLKQRTTFPPGVYVLWTKYVTFCNGSIRKLSHLKKNVKKKPLGCMTDQEATSLKDEIRNIYEASSVQSEHCCDYIDGKVSGSKSDGVQPSMQPIENNLRRQITYLFECCICLQPARNPALCPKCGQIASCTSCLEKWFDSHGRTCPRCREPLTNIINLRGPTLDIIKILSDSNTRQ